MTFSVFWGCFFVYFSFIAGIKEEVLLSNQKLFNTIIKVNILFLDQFQISILIFQA